MFVPLIASSKVADKVTDKATEDALQESVKLEAAEEKKTAPEKRKPEIQVPMSSIVGMRKSNKTAMGCVVSAGLQIDVDDGTVSISWISPKWKLILAVTEHRLSVCCEPRYSVQSPIGFIKGNIPTCIVWV
jgi:hypothetical protein